MTPPDMPDDYDFEPDARTRAIAAAIGAAIGITGAVIIVFGAVIWLAMRGLA